MQKVEDLLSGSEAILLLIAKSAEWACKAERIFDSFDYPILVVKEEDVLSGKVNLFEADIQTVVIESAVDDKHFESILARLDIEFVQSKGPIVVMFGPDDENARAAIRHSGATQIAKAEDSWFDLRRIVAIEASEYSYVKEMYTSLRKRPPKVGDVLQGKFKLISRREAQSLAVLLSFGSPQSAFVAVGLLELIINAIEHGCLEIGHDEKGELIEKGMLNAEIRRRRIMPKYAERYVIIEYEKQGDRLVFTITDPGGGFDYEAYLTNTNGHEKKHGRGIIMAKGCFDELEYFGRGNVVKATHFLNPGD